MDYNINFKYKSGGGTASSGMSSIAGMRQKAIQASTRQGATGTLRPDDNSRKLIDTNVKLSTNLLILNRSITMLNASIKNRGLGGVGGGGGGGSQSDGSGHSIGMVGAGIGMGVGAAAGLLGFAVQKINQVGNAYIEKTALQKGNVGVGGFRRGQGMYNAAEIGEGMKAFGMSSGNFSQKEKVNQTAIQMGNIYGLSASETLGQAGTFKRAGADYSKAMNMGAGAGLESELPSFAATLSQTLEDAIKSGLDTSEMRKDLSGTLLSLVKATPGKSVEGAMAIARSASATRKSGTSGQVSDLKGLLGWKLGQQKALESINTKEGQEALLKEGLLTKDQQKSLQKIGYGNIKEKDVYGTGVNLNYLGQRSLEQMKDTDYATAVYKQGLKEFKGMPLSTMAQTMEYLPSENAALYGAVTNGVVPDEKLERLGKGKLSKASKGVTDGKSGRGVALERSKENLLLNNGEAFAEKTIQMNKAFTDIAEKAAPNVIAGMNKVWTMAEKAATGLSNLSDKLESFTNSKTGKFAGRYAEALVNPVNAAKKLYDDYKK